METKGEDRVGEDLLGGGKGMKNSYSKLWDVSLTNSSIQDAKLKKMRLPVEAGRERRYK